MQLCVAANYDLALVPHLARYPVTEVYGRLPADGIGGGRPRYMARPLSWSRLGEYIRALHRHGIAFNYLLNTACLGNREWSRSFQRGLMRLLDRLEALGVDSLTVSVPYLLELISRRRRHFRLRAGIYAQIDTPRRARFWRDLGADALTLESFSINRDFARLQAIREAVDCELHLVANHPCLPNCPVQFYHQACFAHASEPGRRLFIDYCFLHCTRVRLERPAALIQAQWIRPEDLAAYERLGYEHFKILERDIPSRDLLRRVHAYARRRSPDDLADLVLPYGFSQSARKSVAWFSRHFLRPFQLSPLRLRPFRDFARSQGMLYPRSDRQGFHIASRRLPSSFLESFANRPCLERDCNTCGHCDRLADLAVRIDEPWRTEQLDRVRLLEDDLLTGRLWRVR